MCSAHGLTERNTWVKFYENRSKDSGDIERTRIEGYITWLWPVTLTSSLGSWVMCSEHWLTERNIWVKFNESRLKGPGDMKPAQNSSINHMTLTLELGSWVICSAHRLTNRNIWVKLNENRSKGLGDMEQVQKCYRRNDKLIDWQTDGSKDYGLIIPFRFP